MRRVAGPLCVAILLLASLTTVGVAGPGDITMKRTSTDPGGQAFPIAIFPHTLHRLNFKCYVCHDALFKMKARGNAITMDAILGGKFCGVCHDGKVSFAASVFGSCNRCHLQ